MHVSFLRIQGVHDFFSYVRLFQITVRAYTFRYVTEFVRGHVGRYGEGEASPVLLWGVVRVVGAPGFSPGRPGPA